MIRNQCLIASIPLDRWIAYYLNIRLKFLGSWFSRSYLPHSINCVQICRLLLWIINPPFIDPYVQGINPDPLTSYSLLILIFNSLNSLPLTTVFNCLFPLRHTWIYFVFLQFYSQVSMLNWKSVKPKQKRYPCIAQWMESQFLATSETRKQIWPFCSLTPLLSLKLTLDSYSCS